MNIFLTHVTHVSNVHNERYAYDSSNTEALIRRCVLDVSQNVNLISQLCTENELDQM